MQMVWFQVSVQAYSYKGICEALQIRRWREKRSSDMAESENYSKFAKKGLWVVSPDLASAGSDQKTARCSTVGVLPEEKVNQVWVIGKCC